MTEWEQVEMVCTICQILWDIDSSGPAAAPDNPSLQQYA
jgi:hypothetical protein